MSEVQNIKELDKAYVANTYNRFPVQIVHGKGSLMYDETGKEYIDMGSGIGVTSFGIADEDWLLSVFRQSMMVQHTSNLYYTEPCARLAKLLCDKTGFKKVFFSNSGAEANECATKAARKYAAEKKGEDYSTIVTLRNSFHGRTITTLAATGQDHYHELFTPLTDGFVHAETNNLQSVIDVSNANKTAAILIECIQGEGGVVPLDADFVRGVAEFAKENDILLIVDEVQTGNGRTGQLYAYMNYGIKPDIVSTAKGLGGGLPIGATLLGEKVEYTLGFGDHGSTYGGNPVCCAGAISVISRMDDAFLADVRRKSQLVFDSLSGAPGVKAVTGLGLMVGISTERPAGDIVRECMENGVLCLTAKDKVRLLPALNIPDEVLMRAVDIVKAACAK